MDNLVAYTFIVAGKVQGVGFRWFVKESASRLGITGTVKNLYDGRVEVFAQSDLTNIFNLKDLLAKGPSFSRVDTVTETKSELNQDLKEFKVIF